MNEKYTIEDFKSRKTYWARIHIFRGLTEMEKIRLLDEGHISKKEMYKFVVLLKDKSEVSRRLIELFHDPECTGIIRINCFYEIPSEEEKVRLLGEIEENKKIGYICELKNPDDFCTYFNMYLKGKTQNQRNKAIERVIKKLLNNYWYNYRCQILANLEVENYTIPEELLEFVMGSDMYINLDITMLEKIKKRFINFSSIYFDAPLGNLHSFEEIYELIKKNEYPVKSNETIQFWDINKINIIIMKEIRKKFINNYHQIRFGLRGSKVEDITYYFEEFFEILVKLEDLTSGISADMDEALKFYIIYRRIIENIIYDYEYLEKEDIVTEQMSENTPEEYGDALKPLRKYCAGLYGGLVNRKAICIGYATILYFALQKVGIESDIVTGYRVNHISQNKYVKIIGHAWNQVRIKGQYYNADPTADAAAFQSGGVGIQNMLTANDSFDNYNKYKVDGKYKKCDKDYPIEELLKLIEEGGNNAR